LNAGENKEKQTPAKKVIVNPMKVLFPNTCKWYNTMKVIGHITSFFIV
jgi:hypothetical protein